MDKDYIGRHRKYDNEARYPETSNLETHSNAIRKTRSRIPVYLLTEHKRNKDV